MQNEENNPFGSRFIVAMIIFALFYFGWNSYLQKKYPAMNQKSMMTSETKEEKKEIADNKSIINQEVSNATNTLSKDLKAVQVEPENKIHFENDAISFDLSSHGMGLKNITIKRYTDKNGERIKLGSSDSYGLFEMRTLNGGVIPFKITQSEVGKFLGTFESEEFLIGHDLEFNSQKMSFSSKFKFIKKSIAPLIKLIMPEKITAHSSGSWLFPSYEHQDFYVAHENTKTNLNFSSSKENISKEIKGVRLVSLGSQYFGTALIDQSDLIPNVKLSNSIESKEALAEINYPALDGKDSWEISQSFFVGPKEIDLMNEVHNELAQIINFGWLTVVAKPMLYTMKWIYSQLPNWGIAIILLTIMVRLVVLPFNLMSYKSMKAMQKIQPLMTSVREKYKDDPVRMNQEVMNLMKVHKANPFGGCLPMLIQIPMFFALYRVMSSSVELYQSPFMFWITDLSSHDKFYILPILMGATMFVQQKITPSNMDPTQAKILLYMPLIFTVFMLNLPSGLTLYMFVSGLFGVIQQYLMMKRIKT